MHIRSSAWRGTLLALGLLALATAEMRGAAARTPAQESEDRLRRDITFLASPECEGRGPLTRGIDRAADHIASEFKKAGLKPGDGKSYFQPFTIKGSVQDAPATLVLHGPR